MTKLSQEEIAKVEEIFEKILTPECYGTFCKDGVKDPVKEIEDKCMNCSYEVKCFKKAYDKLLRRRKNDDQRV